MVVEWVQDPLMEEGETGGSDGGIREEARKGDVLVLHEKPEKVEVDCGLEEGA